MSSSTNIVAQKHWIENKKHICHTCVLSPSRAGLLLVPTFSKQEGYKGPKMLSRQ